MNKSFIPLLIIGILLSVSFGLLIMGHMDGQGHSICPFETAANCSQAQGPISSATSHLNAISKFFSAIPADVFIGFISLLVLAIISVLVFDHGSLSLKFRKLFFSRRLAKVFVPTRSSLILSWLSLHENSPALN